MRVIDSDLYYDRWCRVATPDSWGCWTPSLRLIGISGCLYCKLVIRILDSIDYGFSSCFFKALSGSTYSLTGEIGWPKFRSGRKRSSEDPNPLSQPNRSQPFTLVALPGRSTQGLSQPVLGPLLYPLLSPLFSNSVLYLIEPHPLLNHWPRVWASMLLLELFSSI